MGRERAWQQGVALDYAAGLALHHQTGFWNVFWDRYGAQTNVLMRVFKDATAERMQAAGIPEIMRLRIENAMLRQASQADPSDAVNGSFDKSWHFEDSPETKADDKTMGAVQLMVRMGAGLTNRGARLLAKALHDAERARDIAEGKLDEAHRRIEDLEAGVARLFVAGPDTFVDYLVMLQDVAAGMSFDSALRKVNATEPSLLTKEQRAATASKLPFKSQLDEAERDAWRTRRALVALRSKAREVAEVLHKGGAIDPAAMVQRLVSLSTSELVTAYDKTSMPCGRCKHPGHYPDPCTECGSLKNPSASAICVASKEAQEGYGPPK